MSSYKKNKALLIGESQQHGCMMVAVEVLPRSRGHMVEDPGSEDGAIAAVKESLN